jgi:chemotaxis protein methyltransferase CheR
MPQAADDGLAAEDRDLELDLLVRAIHQKYGRDFRGYARGSLSRCVDRHRRKVGCATVSELQGVVLRDAARARALVADIAVHTTWMFRDSGFFLLLRREIVPLLATWPSPNVWVAGCSTGAEVYSMAILLEEAGLLGRAQIHATDASDAALTAARRAECRRIDLEQYARAYRAAGGERSFEDYWEIDGDRAALHPRLARATTFAVHDLAGDQVFAEMQLILCRNVLIYFGRELQDRAVGLFRDALCRGGVLCLGDRESLHHGLHGSAFAPCSRTHRVYRKVTA